MQIQCNPELISMLILKLLFHFCYNLSEKWKDKIKYSLQRHLIA